MHRVKNLSNNEIGFFVPVPGVAKVTVNMTWCSSTRWPRQAYNPNEEDDAWRRDECGVACFISV